MAEVALGAHQAAFLEALTAKDHAAAAEAARLAGEVIKNVTEDLFDTKEQRQVLLSKGLDSKLVAAISVSTPALAAVTVRSELLGLRKDQNREVALNASAEVQALIDGAARIKEVGEHLAKAVGMCFLDEAVRTGDGHVEDGRAFEGQCHLRELLQPSTILPFENVFAKFDANGRPSLLMISHFLKEGSENKRWPAALFYFSKLPNFPRHSAREFEAESLPLRVAMHDLQEAAKDLVLKAVKVDKGKYREGFQAWVARFVALGAPLSQVKTRGERLHSKKSSRCASPGFALNVLGLLLRLVRPITDEDKVVKLVAFEFVLRNERIDYASVQKLRSSASTAAPVDEDDLIDDEEESEEAEALAQAMALSLGSAAPLGFLPEGESFKFSTEIFFLTHAALASYLFPLMEQMSAERRFLSDHARASSTNEQQNNNNLCGLALHHDAWAATLEDPAFLDDALKLASATARWLDAEAAKPDAAERFSKLPSYLLRNCCEIWTLCARLTMGGRKFSLFGPIEAATSALCCSKMMQRTDLITSPLVQAKLVDVVSTLVGAKRKQARPAHLGRKGDDPLTGAVVNSEQCRLSLPLGLITLYSALHAVEGLDVDSDAGFDKFNVRAQLNALLGELWNYGLRDARQAIVDAFKEQGSAFAGAALDTVVYCGFDALDRLEDGSRIDKARKEKKAASGDLPPPPLTSQEQQREQRQKQYYDGQQRTARGFMSIARSTLDLLEELWQEPGVAAMMFSSTMPRFVSLALTLLARVVKGDLVVENPTDWGFDQSQLLGDVTMILSTLETVLTTKDLLTAIRADPDFDKQIFLEICTGSDDDAKRKIFEACDGPLKRLAKLIIAEQAGRTVSVEVVRSRLTAALAEIKEEDDEAYVDALQEVQLSVEEELASDAGFHFSSKRAEKLLTPGLLQKEMRKNKRDIMPPHPDGGIFIVHDEAHINCARVAVMGPVGTPYALGCFVFSIFFPSTYPAVPPLVQLETTGGGRIRFNPNLYADGKVCLSLLGTWHAGDASEKWSPKDSSLRQVLMSILGQILVAEPYFLEPGREGQQGTPEGKAASSQLNAYLGLKTLRHAVLDHLKNPPKCLETIVKEHFTRLKSRLLRRCQNVLDAASDEKTAIVIDDLLNELDLLWKAAATTTDVNAAATVEPPPSKRSKAEKIIQDRAS